ncbi:hypothetical protein CSUI_006103 [Cystoisospora suis]|uniref:Uncharacterized protein n=1 Tax=Cystoisospora suis TaxID=483139 RepID=A0A2C6KUR0_9APIC|nr:hypothetical protein CSUI_006103 [Cystoisospora suis]
MRVSYLLVAQASYMRLLIHRVQLELYALLVSSGEFASLPTRLLAALLIKTLAAISSSPPVSLFSVSSLSSHLPPLTTSLAGDGVFCRDGHPSEGRSFEDGSLSEKCSTPCSTSVSSSSSSIKIPGSETSPGGVGGDGSPRLLFVDVVVEGEENFPARGSSVESSSRSGDVYWGGGNSRMVPRSGRVLSNASAYSHLSPTGDSLSRSGFSSSTPLVFGQLPGFFFSNFNGNMSFYSPSQLACFLSLLAELRPSDLLLANVQNFVAWLTFTPPDSKAALSSEKMTVHAGIFGDFAWGKDEDDDDDSDESATDSSGRVDVPLVADHSAVGSTGTDQTQTVGGRGPCRAGERASSPLSPTAGGGSWNSQNGASSCTNSTPPLWSPLSSLAQRLPGRTSLSLGSSSATPSVQKGVSCAPGGEPGKDQVTMANRASAALSLFGKKTSSAASAHPVLQSLFPSSSAAPCRVTSDVPGPTPLSSPNVPCRTGSGGSLSATLPSRNISARMQTPSLCTPGATSTRTRGGSGPTNTRIPPVVAYPSGGGRKANGFFIFPPPVEYVPSSNRLNKTPLSPPTALRRISLCCFLAFLQRCFTAKGLFPPPGGGSTGNMAEAMYEHASVPFVDGEKDTLALDRGGGEVKEGLGYGRPKQGGQKNETVEEWWTATLRRLVRRTEKWSARILLHAQREAEREESKGGWKMLKSLWGGDKSNKTVMEADGKPSREMFTCLCVVEQYSDERLLNVQVFSSLYEWLVTVYNQQIFFARQKQIEEDAVYKLVHFGFLPRSALLPSPSQPSPHSSAEHPSSSDPQGCNSGPRNDDRWSDHRVRHIPSNESVIEEELDEIDEPFPGDSLEEGRSTGEGEDMHLLVQRLLQMTRRFHDERGLVVRSTSGDSKNSQGVGGTSYNKEETDLLSNASLHSFPSIESSALLLQQDPGLRSEEFHHTSKRSSNPPLSCTGPPDTSRPSHSPTFQTPSSSRHRTPLSSSSASQCMYTSAQEKLLSSSGTGDGSSIRREAAGPRLNRPFLAAVASYCLRLLQQVERQQVLRHQQIVHRTGAAAAATAGAARGCGSGGTSSWALMGGGSGFSAAKGLRGGAGGVGGESLGIGGVGPALYGANLFNSGPVMVLGKKAGVSQAVWDMQMCDAVAVEAMRILDLICRADAELVATVFPTIKRVCERTLAVGGGLHLFTAVFHFYLHHPPYQLFSLDFFVQQYVSHLAVYYRSVLLAIGALTFFNNNLQALIVKSSLFSRYFPVIFKLVAYHPRAAGSLLLPLLPAIVGSSTYMEVLHSLLDLPLTASFLERFDREGAAAACALSSCASKDASCGAAARAAAAAAAACDRGCPFLTALRKYLLRNEAAGGSVVWEGGGDEDVINSLQNVWRRLPITARLSAVCKVVPPSLQVYFRVLLKEAPPHYIEKVLRVLLERFLVLCPVDFYMNSLNKLFLTMVLRIFHRYPIFVITLRTQILHAVQRHLTARGALLARHLCWVMGEYASPHLLSHERWIQEGGLLNGRSVLGSDADVASWISRRGGSAGAELFSSFFDALESLAYEAIASWRRVPPASFPSSSARDCGLVPVTSSSSYSTAPVPSHHSNQQRMLPGSAVCMAPAAAGSPENVVQDRGGQCRPSGVGSASGDCAISSLPNSCNKTGGGERDGSSPRNLDFRDSGDDASAPIGRCCSNGEMTSSAGTDDQGHHDTTWRRRGGRRGGKDSPIREDFSDEKEATSSSDESESDFSSEDETSSDDDSRPYSGGGDGGDVMPAEEEADQQELRQRAFTPCFICVVITAMTKFALKYPEFMPRVVLCFSKLSRCFDTGAYAAVKARVETCLCLVAKSPACASILQAKLSHPGLYLSPGTTGFDDTWDRNLYLDLDSVRIGHLQSLSHYCHTPYNFVPGPRLHLFELASYPPPPDTLSSMSMEVTMARYLFAEQDATQSPERQGGISIPRQRRRSLPDAEDKGNENRTGPLVQGGGNNKMKVSPPLNGASSIYSPGGVVNGRMSEAGQLEWSAPVGFSVSTMSHQASWQSRACGPVPSLFNQPSVTECLAMRQLQRKQFLTP